ncbi:hypothetical protein GGI13_007896 [Coemansia sp. RSA 455]|nr:hypothetical protein LPJ71_010522 [Coemansia sp. S17]KAJ2010038.1 hypothetical protein GGI14_006543 [Coemansia sp. S680]KAJ2036223.1 hypothetical protein H4S03_003787 [Coemansia sp. S3946]KAJ2049095.1 hypothetical protein GGI08_005825 [Coemansia sp. S2]KAJ2055779.1 hypothetical protein GGH13_007733 [Coemansia sp. S155-1]KAJ2113025.1 hypothetical protein IW146_004178 [Coemansia sp. RSA 922]KAJ2239783.1 hypothetical protein GGI13_007896 [Coemansia sp. RSA 455]KAJ2345512.1 hypothetical prote
MADIIVQHPYYPQDVPIPHYVVSKLDMGQAFLTLGSAIAAIMVVSGLLIGRARNTLSCKDKFIVVWMLVCAGIHIVLEGYFSFNHGALAGKDTILADLWREYAHSDSRYLTSDPFTVIMEGITAVFDGSFAVVAAYGILADSPIRHPAQLITSLAQLYGDVLYMLTNYMEGFKYTNPHPMYFYGYFVLMNLPWIVIPVYLIIDSCRSIYRGMLIAQRATSIKKAE